MSDLADPDVSDEGISRERALPKGLSLRAVAPNAVTALALCFGLTAIRYGIAEDWVRAIGAIVIAGFLDGIDGQIARAIRGESRFGAELDSLSDVIAFGVSPTLIIYLWTLQDWPRFGWVCALTLAVCCALRLARFNAAIDADLQPHKSAGFLTGVPAPAGAGLAFVPLYLWLLTNDDIYRRPEAVAAWVLFVAILMISNVATFSWSSLKLRRNIRLEAILLVALVGTSLFSEPLITLIGICGAYLLSIPFSVRSYARVKRLRAGHPKNEVAAA